MNETPQPAAPPEPTGSESRRARLFERAEQANVPIKTILVTIFAVVLVYFAGLLLYRLRSLLLLLLVGGFIALILNPAVDWLQRWRIPRRGFAVLVIALATFVAFGALAFAFGYPLVNALTHLANTLPTELRNAEHGKGWIGHLIARYHVTLWVQKNASKLVSLAHGLSKPALALGKGAISVVVLLITLAAFVILLLIEAPKIKGFLLTTMAPERAQRTQELSRKISRAALGYVRGNLIMSLIAGVIVFVTLTIVHVPFAFLFALWVLLVDFLPQIGGALAGFPTVIFAFIHSTPAGVVTLVVFVVYTLIQNHVLNPLVMSKAMNLNPLVVFIAILVGAELGDWIAGSFGGLVGVLLAIPLAAAAQVLIGEWWTTTHPSPPSAS